MNDNVKLGIIGCGNMGEAIARGIIASNVIYGGNLYFYDTDKGRADYLKASLNANTAGSSEELANTCGAILIAVKPQDIDGLLKEIGRLLDSSKLLISIAAGVTIERLRKFLNPEVRVARVMPNMAALVNQAVSAICHDSHAIFEDKDLVNKIFASIGSAIEVEEKYMDAVTAISGSGPAYFFYLAEILEKAALDMGIDKTKARQLAVKTALGSAELLKDSDAGAEKLRERVTSKGGTTEAAFQIFTEKKLGDILREGIKKAAERARKLSGGS
jgi:pyrroline-5-carboxylate reductase